MFFDSDDLIAAYTTVITLNQTNVRMKMPARESCALSFRFECDDVELTCRDRVYRPKRGDLVFVPKVSYSRYAKSDELTAIHFTLVNAEFNEIELFTPSDSSRYAELFRKVEQSRSDRYVCQSILYEILSLVRSERGEANLTRKARLVLPALKRLRNETDLSSLSVPVLSSLCGLSEPAFRAAFVEATGYTPGEAVTKLKVGRAIELIRSGGYKLDEVAEAVGYCDSKYLSAVIKRITGISPREWTK